LFSHGHWSRTEMVRSFARPAGSMAVLPVVYEARMHIAPEQPGSTEEAALSGAKADK
jgi:hypothetical protein